MIDIEKLRKGLEKCIADDGCHGCPYYQGTSINCYCQIDKDSLELLNYYERLAALHIDLLDNVEALLKTLEEARKNV
jgi:hypothetical protein